MKKFLTGYDYLLLITPIILAAFGVVMVYSASMVSAVANGLESTYYLVKQGQWFVIALVVFCITIFIPYQTYHKLVKMIVLICILALVAVQIFGHTELNATRSLSFMGFNIQPSEFVKIGIIIYLASVYSKKQAYINQFTTGVIPPLVLSLGMVGLIILQPDLGTSAVILFIIATMIVSSGIQLKHILFLGTIGVGMLLLLIPVLKTETRIARFTGAYDPFANADSSGYHLIQSYLAISGGGFTGEGLGQSIQKLGYLWGAHTDFIMSVIAEELGAFGVILVIGLLLLITLRGLYFAMKCKDSFGALLAIGISSMVGIQSIVNLGAISGVLPITGVTLPFISYGGSSLLSLMFSMGILNNVAKHVRMQDEEPQIVEENPINELKQRRKTRWTM